MSSKEGKDKEGYTNFDKKQSFEGEVIDHTKSDKAAKTWFFLSLLWFPIFASLGFVLALKFFNPVFLKEWGILTFGKLRPAHVNGVLFGFVSSGLLAAMLWITPRLCARELWRPKLANYLGYIWNGGVILGVFMILFGQSQGREYAEFPWIIDVVILAVLISLAYIVIQTIRHRRENKLYVSLWYYAGTLLWFPIVYFIGNVMWNPPVGALSGIQDSIFNWYYGHNVLGLWFTTLGIPAWYYFVPKIIKKPLYSHSLSLISFFSIAFFYTGVGGHHLLQAPIPEWLKTIAVITSVLMMVPVLAFATNILLTMRGSWHKLQGNRSFQFIMAGFVFYTLVSIQGSLQGLRTTNQFLHFSQWPVGHAHLALLGGFGFLAIGAAYYLVPKILGGTSIHRRGKKYTVWIGFSGFILFFLAMTVAGLVANSNWWININVVETLPTLVPHFVWRAIAGGIVVVTAYIIFTIVAHAYWRSSKENNFESKQEVKTSDVEDYKKEVEEEGILGHNVDLSVLLAGGLAVFLLMTFMVVAMPYMYTTNEPSTLAHELSSVEEEGEQLYKENGCFYCHTQFTRQTDWARGKTSERGDFYYSTPHFLGTERTGPNLAKIGGKRPTEWHKLHYNDPRNVSPRSVMPSFNFLDESEINALTEYVNHLGTKNMTPQGFQPLTPEPYRGKENPYHHLVGRVSQNMENGSFNGNEELKEEWTNFFEEGKAMFSSKCLPCHGGSGNGQGPYARNTVTRPANLFERIRDYQGTPGHDFHFWRVSEGVPGTAMPPWGESLENDSIWNINVYETSFFDGARRTVTYDEAHDLAHHFAMNNNASPTIEGSEEDFREGEEIYNLYCQQCHGTDGLGHGPASDTSRYGYIRPIPANLTDSASHMQMYGMLYYFMKEGVPTTNMPMWEESLSETETHQVLFYVLGEFGHAEPYNERWAPLYDSEFAHNLKQGGDGH